MLVNELLGSAKLGHIEEVRQPSGQVHPSDCDVRGPRFKSHQRQLFIATATAIYSLGQGLHTLTASSTLH